MRVSVVVCTRNRAEQLKRVLDSAVDLKIPDGLAWEFLLVDNGSVDHTAAVAASYADRLPIRCVREETPGLSNARNRAVAEARGAYICWTDDDVLIDSDWLAAYAEAFDRHPEAAFFGGVIEPVLEGEPPHWFKENWSRLSNIMAERNFGDQVVPLSHENERMPYGANYAVRTREQRETLYDPTLGVSPGHRRLGEESDVLLKMLQAGGVGFWVPKSRVRHMIPRSRQTLRYVRIYQQLAGETWAYLSANSPESFFGPSIPKGGSALFGAPRWLWREAVRHWVLFTLKRPVSASKIWLDHWCQAAYCWGAITYFRRRS